VKVFLPRFSPVPLLVRNRSPLAFRPSSPHLFQFDNLLTGSSPDPLRVTRFAQLCSLVSVCCPLRPSHGTAHVSPSFLHTLLFWLIRPRCLPPPFRFYGSHSSFFHEWDLLHQPSLFPPSLSLLFSGLTPPLYVRRTEPRVSPLSFHRFLAWATRPLLSSSRFVALKPVFSDILFVLAQAPINWFCLCQPTTKRPMGSLTPLFHSLPPPLFRLYRLSRPSPPLCPTPSTVPTALHPF